jgi:alpha-L-fucosidase
MPDGRMEQRQVDLLKQMGDWLKIYGESIYGTTGGPYKPNKNYSSTRKGDKVFIHLPDPSITKLELPLMEGTKVLNAAVMNSETVQVTEINGKYVIILPSKLPDPNSNVIVLHIDRQTSEIQTIGIK